MRHNDAQESLADGIDVAALPPMGPDGAPALESQRELPPEPPRLCLAGPCRNYHSFEIQLDAQNPMDTGRHGRNFHVEVHHYCYPSPGVETNLGSLPVLKCNRWVPVGKLLRTKGMVRRAYERELADFTRDQAEVFNLVADDPAITLAFNVIHPTDGMGPTLKMYAANRDAPLSALVPEMLRLARLPMAKDGSGDPVGFTWSVTDPDGAAFDNLSATPAQLGLSPGAHLFITLAPKETV